MNDFLDNLGANQYENDKKMPPKKKLSTPAKKPTAKKSATKKPTTTCSTKVKSSTKKPKRKVLPIEEMHPFSTFFIV